jgi:hypothetical protein
VTISSIRKDYLRAWGLSEWSKFEKPDDWLNGCVELFVSEVLMGYLVRFSFYYLDWLELYFSYFN